jgi:glycosyltransferase involved in cell wall biosynthesis
VVKHVHRVAGISRSASAEFRGFAQAVRAQGLPGPQVHTVELVTEPPAGAVRPPTARSARPVVLCPGSREPHKNQRAVLHAAERLWREGLDFEVRLVGGAGWTETELRPAIDRLRAAGRPLQELGRVSDAELVRQFQTADLAVFISLHEGYGLPVAEALACGTPVVTSDFGSQREIAEQGGCLMVDPRNDDAITDGLRGLLASPQERDRLRAEIRARPVRTWAQYADELWAFLVEGEVQP